MLEVENQSWQDLNNLIKKVLIRQNKELNKMKYITEKTNYFYNLLMKSLQKKKELDENTIILEDKNTGEEYLAFYNQLTKAICIFKNNQLNIKDYFNLIIREMIWEENKQYFITLESRILRIDILNSYIENDMVTSFYNINNIIEIINVSKYRNLWDLISSYEFQNKAIPENTICSQIRANINGEPKCQRIYSIKNNEKHFILQTNINKEESFNISPFENHENIVRQAISNQNVLKKKQN